MATIIVPIFQYINNKIKRLECLWPLATGLRFSFSKELILLNKIIGLDTRRRKLFILKKSNNRPVCCIVDLRDIQNCSVKKTYGSIVAGGLQRKKLEEYLDTISLHLGFKNRKEQIIINFYETGYNSVTELPGLEITAKHWGRIVSNLLHKQADETA